MTEPPEKSPSEPLERPDPPDGDESVDPGAQSHRPALSSGGLRRAGPAGRDRAGLCAICGLREHAEGLCEGLVPLRALVPDARGSPPALLAADDRPLHHRSGRPGGKRPCPLRGLHRTPPFGPCLGLCAARRAAGPEGSPHRLCAGRHPPQARPAAGAKGSDPSAGPARHAGHPAPRPARPARPRHPADRLCRWVAPVRDREPRSRQGRHARQWRLGRDPGGRRADHASRQDRLARGGSRPRLQHPDLSGPRTEQWLHYAKIDFGRSLWPSPATA